MANCIGDGDDDGIDDGATSDGIFNEIEWRLHLQLERLRGKEAAKQSLFGTDSAGKNDYKTLAELWRRIFPALCKPLQEASSEQLLACGVDWYEKTYEFWEKSRNNDGNSRSYQNV